MVPQRFMHSLEKIEYTHGWTDGQPRKWSLRPASARRRLFLVAR